MKCSPRVVLMFEIDVHVPAAVQKFPDFLGDLRAGLSRVISLSKPEIGEIGGKHFRNFELVRFSQAQRDVVPGETLVNFVNQPGWMPKFKCEAQIGRKQGKICVQAWKIAFKCRRELIQHGPQSPRCTQRLERF